jgi:hypothetical protein
LTIESHRFAWSASLACIRLAAGSSLSVTVRAAAMCMAVGKLSFEDWLLLT